MSRRSPAALWRAWRSGAVWTRATLLIGGFALIIVSWAMADAPFAAPDEWAHYVRAVGVSRGEILGEKPTDVAAPLTPAERWTGQAARIIEIPSGLWAEGLGCYAFQPDISAQCLRDADPESSIVPVSTPVGTYEPLPYVLPGLALRLADDPFNGMYLGRLAMSLSALILLALAARLLISGREPLFALAGLLLAFTPMVAFTMSSFNPSSLEIAAGIALACGAMRLAFDASPDRFVWLTAGAAAAVLALSRSVGPLWVALFGLVVIGLRGIKPAWTALWRGRPWSVLAVIGAGTAVLANAVWEAKYGPEVTISLVPFPDSLIEAGAALPPIIRQQIGVFGYLDTSMPQWAYLGWFFLLVMFVVLAFLLAKRRQRVVLVSVGVVAAVTPILLLAAMMRHTGFGTQGRHVLAFTVLIPILAGTILSRRVGTMGDLAPRNLPVWVATGAGAIHIVAWYTNARRNATGLDGPIWFAGTSEWVPPGGWIPWAVLLLLGVGLLVTALWPQPVRTGRSTEARSV